MYARTVETVHYVMATPRNSMNEGLYTHIFHTHTIAKVMLVREKPYRIRNILIIRVILYFIASYHNPMSHMYCQKCDKRYPMSFTKCTKCDGKLVTNEYVE